MPDKGKTGGKLVNHSMAFIFTVISTAYHWHEFKFTQQTGTPVHTGRKGGRFVNNSVVNYLPFGLGVGATKLSGQTNKETAAQGRDSPEGKTEDVQQSLKKG